MKYSGIDLHSNNSVVTVTDEQDRIVAEKRLPNDLTKIVGLLTPWREELAGVVVESTFNWYWLVDGLKAAGFTVHLANTTAIKKYEGLKHSGDEADARYLAHLLRLGILPTGTILEPEHRAVRDLARKRMQLVRSRTAHILAVENITARHNGVRISSNGKKKGQGNTKNGNKYLAWAFIEAANFAMRFNAEAKRFYDTKKAKTNNVVAIKALAHKLARACYHMLKEGRPFDVTRCFA